MAKKTPITIAIERLEKLQRKTGSSQADQIAILKLLLPAEKEAIEEAIYNALDSTTMIELTDCKRIASHYFTTTYTN